MFPPPSDMSGFLPPLDLQKLKVYPLAERQSQSRLEELMVEPADPPPPCPENVSRIIRHGAQKMKSALNRNAAVLLIYGAHLIKNAGQLLVNHVDELEWVTSLNNKGDVLLRE